MTYRIQKIATQNELVVHYDRLKTFHAPPPTSIVRTRDRGNPKNVSLPSPRQHEQILPEFGHNQCTWHYPYLTVPSATTCSHGVACTTSTAAPASSNTPFGSPKSVHPSPSSFHSGATAPYSHGSPGTPRTTTSFRTSTPKLEPLALSAESPVYSRNFPSRPSTLSSVRSKPRFCEVIANASCNLQFGDAPTQAPPQRNLRNSTIRDAKLSR